MKEKNYIEIQIKLQYPVPMLIMVLFCTEIKEYDDKYVFFNDSDVVATLLKDYWLDLTKLDRQMYEAYEIYKK